MTTINGNLELKKDTTYDESLTVSGSIFGKNGVRYNLTVKGDIDCMDINCRNITCGNLNCGDITCGNINCWDINCRNIDCRNIDCGSIDCYDINCWNINCGNLDAYFILCETLKQREGSTLIAKSLTENRSGYKLHEIKRKKGLK